jgi:hypothetical protein
VLPRVERTDPKRTRDVTEVPEDPLSIEPSATLKELPNLTNEFTDRELSRKAPFSKLTSEAQITALRTDTKPLNEESPITDKADIEPRAVRPTTDNDDPRRTYWWTESELPIFKTLATLSCPKINAWLKVLVAPAAWIIDLTLSSPPMSHVVSILSELPSRTKLEVDRELKSWTPPKTLDAPANAIFDASDKAFIKRVRPDTDKLLWMYTSRATERPLPRRVAEPTVKSLASSIAEVTKPVLSEPRRARLSTLTVLPNRTKLATDMLLWTITSRLTDTLEPAKTLPPIDKAPERTERSTATDTEDPKDPVPSTERSAPTLPEPNDEILLPAQRAARIDNELPNWLLSITETQ